ncbi:hypothetical protein BDF20DRAFT_913602 [Mycotypha africana]|uniref:uncharacterized protein n=1 Tax=Mycotypha africana TaxID=64632 RepID=UPI0023009483|nr:uncharacterized protein BDF20DRAFT_913602 [Mycotypha africana]KAI8977254.1 hypothetical protein BDF20DRAFT_913602 [Mycotypha africana]
MSAVAAVTNDIATNPVNDTNVSKKAKEAQQHKLRRKNKKKNKKLRKEEEARRKAELEQQQKEKDDSLDVEIEYVVQPVDMSSLKNIDGLSNVDDSTLQQFSEIFKHFQTGKAEEDEEEFPVHDNSAATDRNKDDKDDDSDKEGEEMDTDQTLSKKKMKKLQRLTVAELKQLVKKPEVVEWWDVTANDPKLLTSLKSYRNTVPVPAHWSMKRKYLQGKRGIEKPPWELPDFIKDTGIMEMRDAVKEKENAAGLKGKTKEKVNPKMGKLDIDYQKLHDAFFRFQTRGNYTKHGELYYEGKEFETKIKEQKPGQLSEELKEALNMPPLAPPPWLINMQRYGPPPSYPNLKIPGLNAPIPEGAQWGYHPGGWGRPPVDEYNRPLYGDVFGVAQPSAAPPEIVEPVDKNLWGELESEEEYEEVEEEEESEEESEAEEAKEEEPTGAEMADGLVTPSGMASIASGLTTPDHIELRKDRKKEEDEGPKQLYQVLPEVSKNITGFMGSQHGYDLSAVNKATLGVEMSTGRAGKRKAENIDVAIDPSELENGGLDEATLRAKYEAQMRAKLPVGAGSEDLSDMYAEHASRQAKKARTQDSRKEAKKKEFKF